MSMVKLVKLGMAAARNNLSRLPRPYKLNFCVTYRCQSRCLTCNIWQMRPDGELTLAEIREFAHKNPYFRWIQLTGGEPFLRPDLKAIVEAFQEGSPDLYVVTIPTNSLCHRDAVVKTTEAILATGVPKLTITVSLDGSRELNDRIRGVPGHYDKAVALFRELSELAKTRPNLAVFLGYTMSKHNQGAIERTLDAVRCDLPMLSASDVHINLAQYSDLYYQNGDLDLAPQREAAAGELRRLIRQRGFELGAVPLIERAFLAKLLRYVETGTTRVKSRSLDASLYLDSFGDVYPSIMWDRKIGNIRDTGYKLAPLWDGEPAMEARQLIREGREPTSWTACEAHQALVADVKRMIV